jgi:hypothetical protein
MWLKRILLFSIVLAAYVHIMVNNPDDGIKAIGYKPMLDYYASRISYAEHIKIIYDPGLRKLSVPKEQIKITAVLPECDNDHEQIVGQLFESKGFAIIQCSAMDNWHTTAKGKTYLDKMYQHGYRAVVFDGGHHLPTLGLGPDIIIVPQMAGYTVHSYMRDGMKVEKIHAILKDINSPAVIAVLPRWALIKQEKALVSITKTVLNLADYRAEPAGKFSITAENRMSKYNNHIFIYINNQYYKNPSLLIKRISRLGINDVHKIYLAFDYQSIDKYQALAFTDWLHEQLAIKVETVNEPVNVFNAFWGGK